MSTTCSPFNVASQKYGGNCLEESSSNGLSNACINTINGNVSAGWESASNGTIDSFIKIGFHTVFTINKLRIRPSLVSGRQIKDILMEFSDCSYEKVRSQGENCQGRNEVYGIRDQGPKKGWDPGSQPLDLGSQPPGSGSAVSFIGSRIRRSGSTKFCKIRDQNSHHVWNQGSKIWVKLRDQR